MRDPRTEDPKLKNYGSDLGSGLTPQRTNIEPLNKKKQKLNSYKKNPETPIFGTNIIELAINRNRKSKK